MNRLRMYYYVLRYRLLKWIWNCCTNRSFVNGLILMYHHISYEHLDALESCQHTVEQFKNSLNTCLERGYTFVSIQMALNLIKERSSQKFAVVTFDDVPIDAYENAVPILNQMQIPYAFFITTSFIGREGYLTKKQLIELDKQSLCTIGAHTTTHPNLRTISDPAEELKSSKIYLETLLGHPVDYLAYPYGRQSSVSRKVRKLAEAIGYKCAFGTIPTALNDISIRDIYYLPRVVIKS